MYRNTALRELEMCLLSNVFFTPETVLPKLSALRFKYICPEDPKTVNWLRLERGTLRSLHLGDLSLSQRSTIDTNRAS